MKSIDTYAHVASEQQRAAVNVLEAPDHILDTRLRHEGERGR